MDKMYFTAEHHMFRDSLSQFLNKEVIPMIDEWETQGRVPREVVKKMGDMGFFALGFPKEYGGAELDFFYDVIKPVDVIRQALGLQ